MKDDKSCCSTGKCGTKLSPCNLGISLGVTWGLTLALLACLGVWFGMGRSMTVSFGDVFHGFNMTYKGALHGFGWGLLQGYISGVVLAVVYNFSSCRCPCASCKIARK